MTRSTFVSGTGKAPEWTPTEKIAVFCAKLPFTTTDTRVKFVEVAMWLVFASRFAVVLNRTSRLQPKRLQIEEGHRAARTVQPNK
ncbi:MAG TPA: hypothetical protein VFQ26_05650 [Nitrospiraceae bacterium]|nr:hypothetical protein [Nitrospiraceae bacterium]